MAASEPTFPLSEAEDALWISTLSRHFGALTLVRVVSLSEQELTPHIPFPTVYSAGRFGVRQAGWRFPSRLRKSVLYTAGHLASDLTAASFGRNQLSPSLIGLSPLLQGYPTELHVKTGSDLHPPEGGLRPTPL
jgi:hypothetical protein